MSLNWSRALMPAAAVFSALMLPAHAQQQPQPPQQPQAQQGERIRKKWIPEETQ